MSDKQEVISDVKALLAHGALPTKHHLVDVDFDVILKQALGKYSRDRPLPGFDDTAGAACSANRIHRA